MQTRRLFLLFLLTTLWAPVANAGLRDILPRPQQMGLLSEEAVLLEGTPVLVIPDNPTLEESFVREEAIRLIALRTGRTLGVIYWSMYSGETPALWVGTLTRFPALAAALDSTRIPGLGTTTREEEYQLVVEPARILLGGHDTRALRWGLISLVQLMAEVRGRLSVERAYIRDWPDFPKRVVTANSAVNQQWQLDFCNLVADLAYRLKVNEIEWGNLDASKRNRREEHLANERLYMARLRRYGFRVTMPIDNTAKSVTQPAWQEAVPLRNLRMIVTANGFVPSPNGYQVPLVNGGLENWNGNRPANWILYRDWYYDYLFRDTAIKYSGTSSARFQGFSSTSPRDLELRQFVRIGSRRLLKVKFWYRLSNYVGRIRIDVQGAVMPYNRCDMKRINFYTPTTQDWTQGEMEFCTFNVDSALLLIGPRDATQGTLWIDDITFEPGDLQEMVRRPDTPLEVYKLPQELPLLEGLDFRVVETAGVNFNNYVRRPRLEALSGGRLAEGDSVRVHWSCAFPYMNRTRQMVCVSLLEPLLEVQDRVRVLDSLWQPDGVKLQINEAPYTNYDATCTRRNLTCGQLVGRFCGQMAQIAHAQQPNWNVRIYGDPFDEFVFDLRAMPVPTLQWNYGALAELPPYVEMMAMCDYSSNVDSTFAFFSRYGRQQLLSYYIWTDYDRVLSYVRKAKNYPLVRGMEAYFWNVDESYTIPSMTARVTNFARLAWNLGPFIVHHPLRFQARPDSIVIAAEMWSDTFGSATPPQLVSQQLHYRLLPGGSWNTVSLEPVRSDMYAFVIRNLDPNLTGVEYYLSATDHRQQTRTAPADAPARTFLATIPFSGTQGGGGSRGEDIEFTRRELFGHTLLEWAPQDGVACYEVHTSADPDFSATSCTRLARQHPACPRLLLTSERLGERCPDSLHVFVIREPIRNPKLAPPRQPNER